MLNKFMNTRWFVLLTSFIMAVMLFMYAAENKTPRNSSSVINVNHSQTISNVPVIVNMDQEKYTVSGLPESVTVRLDGPSSSVIIDANNKNYKVSTPDLNELSPGKHVISLILTGLSDQVKGVVTPETAEIFIEEKKQTEVSVNIRSDSPAIKEAFERGLIRLNPHKVSINGPKSLIEQVKDAVVDIPLPTSVTEDYTVTGKVQLLDASETPLELVSDPDRLQVSIPITLFSKIVPVQLVAVGTNSKKIELNSPVKTVGVIGSVNALQNLTSISVPVDIANATQTLTETYSIGTPTGIDLVLPKEIEVEIKVLSDSTDEASNQENASDSSQTILNRSNESSSSSQQ